jgi:acetolactate synthase-1/2/3 large subunit
MNGAALLVRCLEEEGVRWVFGVPGEENIDFIEALETSSIEFVVTRHEQGAAFMAGMIGKVTGIPGVCLSTLGPGATNLVTGVATANMDRSPLVAITGQAGITRMHKQSHQVYDLIALFEPITKWNGTILTGSTVPEIVRKAFARARAEKPGATHIELPEDIASQDAKGVPIQSRTEAITTASKTSITEAARHINESRRPIVLVGHGVTRCDAGAALLTFLERTQAHAVETFMGKGAVPWIHPLSLMTAGIQKRDHIACGFDHADLIITVGFDIEEYAPSVWNPDGKAPIVHIDTMEAEVDASYPVQASLIGDIRLNLQQLTEEVHGRKQFDPYYNRIRESIMQEWQEAQRMEGMPVKPQRIVAALREVMERQDIVISDVGAHKIWMARMFPCYEPNTCFISNGMASMGIALPSAMAAKLANPGKRVVAVCGDGAFQMSVQELETAVRLKLSIVVMIWRDERYGLIEWKQKKDLGHASHISFDNPDLTKLAEAYGAIGLRVEKTADLVHMLDEAFKMDGPVVIDCPVDAEENMKLTEKLGKIICPV